MATITVLDTDSKTTWIVTGPDLVKMTKAARARYLTRTGDNSFSGTSATVESFRNFNPDYQFSKPQAGNRNSQPATDRQIAYLNILGVRIEPGLTMKRASALIDAAKSHDLGTVGGFYEDGSN